MFVGGTALWRARAVGIVRAQPSHGLITASGDDDRATDDFIDRLSLLKDAAYKFRLLKFINY